MKNLSKSFLFVLLVTFLLGSSVLVGCRNPFIEGIVPQAPVGGEQPSDTPSGDQSGTEQPGDTPSDDKPGSEQPGNTPGEDVDGDGTEAVVPPPTTGNYSAVDSDKWAIANYKLGATVVGSDVEFAVYSKNATKILLEIYEEAYGQDAKYTYWMVKNTSDDIWRAKVAGIGSAFATFIPFWVLGLGFNTALLLTHITDKKERKASKIVLQSIRTVLCLAVGVAMWLITVYVFVGATGGV